MAAEIINKETEKTNNNLVDSTMTNSSNSIKSQTKPPFELKQPLAVWPLKLSLIIFGIQFLERFSFYFLKSTLSNHLIDNLKINILTANTSQKLIIQVTLFAAIVGGIMCDIKYGRYGTLAWFFPIYLVGQALITFSPLIPLPGFFHPYFDFFALFLLSYGCGCIKAVLAAYGADQFKPPNVTQIGCFFALFYSLEQFSIIFGIYLLPIIKFFSQIPTDKPSLNILSLATFLLLISIGYFNYLNYINSFFKVILFGTSNYFYKFIPQNKNQNIFIKSFKIIKQSLINKYRRKPLITSTKQPTPKYLLEHFLIDHNCQRDRECDFGRKNICEQTKFIGELQTVIQISFVLLPLSIFWALRTKLISINISQIQNIDTKLPFIGQLPFLPPDQICCLLQPIFVILLLPLFYVNMFIFKSPSISQCLSLNTYLRRIFIGIFLCSVACFCSANIQKLLLSNNNSLIKSTEDFTLIKLFNLFPSKCSFSISKINSKENFVIIEANNSNIFSLKSEDLTAGYVDLLFRFNGSSCSSHRKNLLRIWLNSATNNQFNIALVGPQGIFFTSLDIKNTKTNGPSNYLGFLNLLPCNSLSSSSFSLPSECSNSTNDILTQALTPLKQSLSICDDSNNCPINWDLNEVFNLNLNLFLNKKISSSTFFVFPPNGDNVGKGRGSVYSIKAIPTGKYQFSDLIPQTIIPTTTNSTINPPLNISNNPLISLLPQNINVDGTGSIWLAVLSLDGSPLAGQNDSTTSSSLPNPIFTFLLLSGPPQLGILWLFPQNLLIAASEVLISVTGLEFCYMKFFQLLFCSFSLFNVALIFALIAYFYYNYRDNSSINGGFVENNQKQLLTEEIGGKFTEKLSGTLRASMARLPTKKVIRL
ncbi:unnamed protein product [Meloidogyne enterolobii]|uniref:Uncharacterized protein n=1 Tax=Meloidogyne enterolobii TaxID=390850 RepID=A0ACB0Y365_MELEN